MENKVLDSYIHSRLTLRDDLVKRAEHVRALEVLLVMPVAERLGSDAPLAQAVGMVDAVTT
jgi:hypothetical protein